MAIINELSVKAMNKELGELFEAFAKKHGLRAGNQRIVYARDGSTMKMTVEFGDKSTVGDTNPVFYRNLARTGFRFGLSVSMIGQFIKTASGPRKLVGLQGKYAILEGGDKKLWKMDAVMVAMQLKAAYAKSQQDIGEAEGRE